MSILLTQAAEHRHGWNCECLNEECRRHKVFSQEEMKGFAGEYPGLTIHQFGARLKCECGHKGARLYCASPDVS